jgi:hypothetical protein
MTPRSTHTVRAFPAEATRRGNLRKSDPCQGRRCLSQFQAGAQTRRAVPNSRYDGRRSNRRDQSCVSGDVSSPRSGVRWIHKCVRLEGAQKTLPEGKGDAVSLGRHFDSLADDSDARHQAAPGTAGGSVACEAVRECLCHNGRHRAPTPCQWREDKE